MMRLQVVHVNNGQTAQDQIAFHTLHSFLVGVQTNAGCIHVNAGCIHVNAMHT